MKFIDKIKNLFIKKYSEKEITIVIASYNNAKWYKRNLDSVFNQNYSNYKVIYIDDCSTDNTGNLVEEYAKVHNYENKINLIKNKKRGGATINRYKGSHLSSDNSIVMILDGDDWLAHDNVMNYINKLYNKYDIWVTYGQFRRFPSGEIGHCKKIPPRYNFSKMDKFYTSHLRTYYAWLFKSIPLADFQIDGKFPEIAGDVAEMLPLIKLAQHRAFYAPKVLYIYNQSNPLNDYKIDPKNQDKKTALFLAKYEKSNQNTG